jgi:TonB family protein
MKKFLPMLLLLGTGCFAQQVYQPNEVDQQAAPIGGIEVLNLFLTSNLRVPMTSGWRGINKRVFIKAIVEKDGSASDIQVIRGIDTLCNAEAVRVMRLYKAWKPALLQNASVRQNIIMSVPFKSDAVAAYDSVTSSLITHFDNKWIVVSDPKAFHYKRSIPVDEFGFMNRDILYEERDGNKWTKLLSVPLIKEEIWEKVTVTEKKDSVRAVRISATVDGWNVPTYQLLVKQENGNVLLYNEFMENGTLGLSKSYHLNGVLKELETDTDEIHREIAWYANGLLASIVQRPPGNLRPFNYKISEFYDENGNHMIVKGDGFFGPGTYQRHGFEGHGAVMGGLKEGLWVAKSKDSTLLFEEHYEKGKLIKGVSYSGGEKLAYTEVEIQPEFKGGIGEMYKYLGKNIVYPSDAARSNIQGKVFASFVVCQDGTLCDFEIVRGVYKSVDREALRVIEGMSGKWTPGWQRGKKVKVKYNLPINFQLR